VDTHNDSEGSRHSFSRLNQFAAGLPIADEAANGELRVEALRQQAESQATDPPAPSKWFSRFR